MRKIDKSKILSTEYKEWLEQLDRDGKRHPKKSDYYHDVIMNLLYCQNGVCAYTEYPLCNNPELYDEDKWKDGRHTITSVEITGEIEHFDSTLKKDKHWQWDNLFAVHERINKKKGKKDVDDIMKPDSPGYDPMVLLEYDKDLHIFSPNRSIKNEVTRKGVKDMIAILRLNYDFIRRERKRYLDLVFKLSRYQPMEKIDRFFTAYQMVLPLNNQE